MSETTSKDEELIQRAESARGKVLRDKWCLDQVLGIGGMATVYSATHRNGKRAAVKVLHPEAALAPTVKDSFLREGYLANKVDHPGAVSILDDDIDADGTVFLVMELLLGETLDNRSSRMGNKVAPPELLQIVDQVLDCLHAAHSKGIVHRDIKPGNLFITQAGVVKILDFGIARLDTGEKKTGGTGGQTLGTPGFMAPEQARGRWGEVDAQSDLWAVGAVLFASLSGHHVHEAPTVNEQLLAAMTVPARPIKELNAEVPDSVAVLVDQALAFTKESRWPSARAMQEAVRAAYESVTGKPMEQAPRLSIRPPPGASVNQNDQTIDAAAIEAARERATTARPVTSPLKSAGGRRTLGVVAVFATLAAAVAGYLLLRQGPDKDTRVEAARSAASENVTAARAAQAAMPAKAPPPPAEAVAPAPSESAKLVPPPRKAQRPPVSGGAPTTAKPAAAAPDAPKAADGPVDLFSRRK